MFTKRPHRQQDIATAHDLIEKIRLGTLVTITPRLDASPIPFLLHRRRGPLGTLVGHMSRANRQWKVLEEQDEVLVSFTGPHTYVSASWYETGPRVSTWYYAAVHAYGKARVIGDDEGMLAILDESFRVWGGEDERRRCWTADPNYVRALLPGIMGFEIELTRFEAQQQMGQESPDVDNAAVRRVLGSGDLLQRQVAEWMPQRTGGAD